MPMVATPALLGVHTKRSDLGLALRLVSVSTVPPIRALALATRLGSIAKSSAGNAIPLVRSNAMVLLTATRMLAGRIQVSCAAARAAPNKRAGIATTDAARNSLTEIRRTFGEREAWVRTASAVGRCRSCSVD